jgi:hypothetical protein
MNGDWYEDGFEVHTCLGLHPVRQGFLHVAFVIGEQQHFDVVCAKMMLVPLGGHSDGCNRNESLVLLS